MKTIALVLSLMIIGCCQEQQPTINLDFTIEVFEDNIFVHITIPYRQYDGQDGYSKGDVVLDEGKVYQSLVDLNFDNKPIDSSIQWKLINNYPVAYSLDGQPFQDNYLFQHVVPGSHRVTITDGISVKTKSF